MSFIDFFSKGRLEALKAVFEYLVVVVV